MESQQQNDFLKKIERTAAEVNALDNVAAVERDTKIDLLLYLKSQLSLVSSRNHLKETVITSILNKMEEGDVTTGQLIKLLEVLDASENEKMSSILGVLKQQSVVNNNFNGNTGVPGSEASTVKEIPIKPEDYHTAKRVMSFLDKVTTAEFPEKAKDDKIQEPGN